MNDAAPHETGANHRAGPGIERNLGLFQVYRFLSTSYLFAPIIVVFFRGRGLDVTEITLLNTVYCATAMLFEVPTGVLADRWGRRRAMVLGSLMMATGCGLDFVGRTFSVFAVGEGLLALGITLTSGADSAYLYDLLLDAGRQHEYRRREGAASAAKLLGAAAALAAGGWIAHKRVDLTYLLTAGICVTAALVALLLREAPPAIPARHLPLWSQMTAGVRTVVQHAPLRFAVLFSALVFTLVRMSIYVHQPWLSKTGFSLTEVGLVLSVLSLLAALGAHRVEVLRRHLGEPALLVGLPLVLSLSYFALGRWFAPWGIAMLLAQSVANGIYSPLSKDLLNREIADSSRRATILSVESMARRLVFGAFAPVAGALIDRGGLPWGLWACGGLGALGAVWLATHLGRRATARSASFRQEHLPHPAPPDPDGTPPEDLVGVPAPMTTVVSGGIER